MLLALTATLLFAPVIQEPGQTRTTQTVTTRRTFTIREPVTRITVNAGERVRITLANPDRRTWTAARPITPTVRLLSPANVRGSTSTFEYSTSTAVRSTLEFRHASGLKREVRLTVAARGPQRPPVRRGTTSVTVSSAPITRGPAQRVALRVTPEQEDAMITVSRGAIFEIRLPTNPSTGYQWRPEPWPRDLVRLQSSTYIADQAESGVTGSGGTQVFRLVAIGRGTADIDLISQGPNKERGERFHFVLEVL